MVNPRSLSVCIINPRFEPSFWGHEFTLPLIGRDKRCWTVSGALPALAALAPYYCVVTVIDENVEPIDFGRLESFDVVGLTGMITQRQRMREILTALNGAAPTIVVGGPCVTAEPEEFAHLADVRFLGEAEETWPAFLHALAFGEEILNLYSQGERTDMTTVPPPRYDVIKSQHYVAAAIQFSRGCPFLCEFCDIITVFGRRPRLKTTAQLIAELDVVRSAGFTYCFLVDDNFIGNKKAIKEVLRSMIEWQQKHGYPMQFYTETSVNLADDSELVSLMVEAGILQVFVGLESPRRASLEETKKYQNISGDSLDSKVSRLRDGGLVITAGFIVGFDSDDERIFEEQYDFIQRSGVAQAIVAILMPIAGTPLYSRLLAEGRLAFDDPEVAFKPKQMTREVLKKRHRELLLRLYEPSAFFNRLMHGYVTSPAFRRRRSALTKSMGKTMTWKASAAKVTGAAVTAVKLFLSALRSGHGRVGFAYAHAYLRKNLSLGREAIPFHSFVTLCTLHWHYFNMARHERITTFSSVQSGDRPTPDLIRIEG
jgi:radical SAM superfamily enzyme YgiQ (UPF0313 family)